MGVLRAVVVIQSCQIVFRIADIPNRGQYFEIPGNEVDTDEKEVDGLLAVRAQEEQHPIAS